MLEDYRKSRGSDFDPIPVVSSVIGETGSYKQIQKYRDLFYSILLHGGLDIGLSFCNSSLSFSST